VNLGYTCSNPASCSVGNLLDITPYNLLDAAQTPVSVPPGAGSVTLYFDASANAKLVFNYRDAGEITINASKAAGGSLLTALSGSSNPFVTKPWGFKLALTCASNFSSEPTAYCPAGETASGTVTAVRYDGTQPNNLGAATPNFADTVSFAPKLIAPTVVDGGTATAFANVLLGGTWVSGQTTLSLNWPEVGTTSFTPAISYLTKGDLLAAGKSDSEAFFGSKRFYPYRMALADNGSLEGHVVSNLTYVGQPFQLGFSLTAQNKTGNPVKNYGLVGYTQRATGAAISIAAENSDNGTSLGTNVLTYPVGAAPSFTLTWPSTSGSDAVATVAAASYQYSRAALIPALDAMRVGIRFADDSSDAVPLVNGNMNPATAGACVACDSLSLVDTRMRYGRLRMQNAYGSELLPLNVPVRAEYCAAVAAGNCASWLLNAIDGETLLAPVNVVVTNANPIGTSLPTVSSVAGSGGLWNLKLTPGAAVASAFDIALNLGAAGTDTSCNTSHGGTAANLPWLQGNWCGVAGYVRDPNARIKFGSPKAPYIYLRERY
jgi:MSHA biogenesis protein MshQ